MAEPAIVAALSISCLQALSKVSDAFSIIAKDYATWTSNSVNVLTCLQKVEAFSDTWGFGIEDKREVPLDQVLWEESSSLRVESILNLILDTTNQIQLQLSKSETEPHRSLLKRCKFWIREQTNSLDHSILDSLISKLISYVDVGWAYYHAAAESQELLASQQEGSIRPLADDLATQQAKEVSLALYDVIRTSEDKQFHVYSIDLDLAGHSCSHSKQPALLEGSFPQLSFRLFLQSQESPDTWKQIVVSGTDELQASEPYKLYQRNDEEDFAAKAGFVYIRKEEVSSPISKFTPSEDYFVKLAKARNGDCFERLQFGLKEAVLLQVTESLAPVLPSPHVVTLPELFKEPMAMTEKLDLAYTIARYGFYTLGTPWASFLQLGNILRMSRTDGRSRFLLNVTDSMDYSPNVEDPHTFAETSHLLQIGVLLTEIGLQKEGVMLKLGTSQSWPDRIETLGEVERAMGRQYCRAVAFCLQPRHALAQSKMREKFDYNDNEHWRNYSSEILGEYYEHVLKRLESFCV